MSASEQHHSAPNDLRASDWHARVWTLAWPTILSNISAPVVAAVDTAMVGHLGEPRFIGAVAIGAVIFTFVQWGFSFLRMGTTGLAAQALGGGHRVEVNATAIRALIVAVIVGFALVMAQNPIATLAFYFMQGSAAVEAGAQSYFAIRIWGAPAVLINMAVLGMLFALQRMRAALVTQLVLNVVNVILDVVFVVGFDLGVVGVAWASVIAETVAAGLGLYFLWQALVQLGGAWHGLDLFNAARLRGLLVTNANIFLRTLAVQITFFYFASAGARQGDIVLAANALLLHLFQIMSYGLDGFAFAVEALVGNAYGARNAGALRAITRSAAMWSALTAIAMSLSYWILGESLLRLMTDVEIVITTAKVYLPWLICAPLICVWCYLFDGVFFGTTHTREARNSIVLAAAAYFPLVWLLTPSWSNHGLWFAVLVFMAVRGIALWLWFPRVLSAATPESSTRAASD